MYLNTIIKVKIELVGQIYVSIKPSNNMLPLFSIEFLSTILNIGTDDIFITYPDNDMSLHISIRTRVNGYN